MSTNGTVTRKRNGTTSVNGTVVGRIERRVEPMGNHYGVRWYVYDVNGAYVTAAWSLALAKDAIAFHARVTARTADPTVVVPRCDAWATVRAEIGR